MRIRDALAASVTGERGQAIILFVGVFSVILIIAAIVVDFGLWFAERRSAQRAADLAATAAAMELPFNDADAQGVAIQWADKNGVSEGVTVTLLCRNTIEASGLCVNPDPASGPSDCDAGQGCDTVRVKISKDAPRLFTALSVFDDIDVVVEAGAAAGVTFGSANAVPDQTIILLDAQERMGDLCGSDPSGCPIAKAREGALGLVSLLMPSGGTQMMGYAPFHNCYGASSTEPPVGCVRDQGLGNLVVKAVFSIGVSQLTNAIESTTDYDYKANICVPLSKAPELFLRVAGGRRALVLLSDGDNLDQRTDEHVEDPPPECDPGSPLVLGGPPARCSNSRPAESQLDLLTLEVAEELKAQGVEIFVIGTRMCGVEDGQERSAGYCGAVGQSPAHDNQEDQRLLKCIASSPDHYQRVDVEDLPDAFRNIAVELATRSLLQ